jgi:hypothetical protein
MGFWRAKSPLRTAARMALVPATALVVLAAWTAAPALSLRPYVPKPVDFELHDSSLRPQPGAQAASGGRDIRVYVSKALKAPRRFNLVGLRWHGARTATVVVRVRKHGGRWSRWTQIGAEPDHAPDIGSAEARRARHVVSSDPLWAGEADELQYSVESGAPVRDVTLHFVNSKGTATPLDRLRTGLRRAVSGAVDATFGAVASLLGSDVHADTGQPTIITRDKWGASSCPPRAAPSYGEVKLAFIHHTVTANDYSPGDSAAMVLAICRYHRNSNGWNDIGYQFLVDKYGQIFEGRAGGMDQAVVGAQAQGYNTQSTGIANLGTFSTAGQTDQGLSALARLLTWKLSIHGVDPHGQVVVRSGGGSLNRYPAGVDVKLNAISGHRDADGTACPGDGLYAQLDRLRSMVVPDPRASTQLGLGAARGRIPYGRKARLAGKLAATDGSPVAGLPVQVQSLGALGRTGTITTVPTDATGSFSVNVRLAFNRQLRAFFGGDPALRAASSPSLHIGVRPRVTASLGVLAGARLQRGRRVLVTGSVRPRKPFALFLVDRQRPDGSFRRIAKSRVRLRRGRARVAYRFRHSGSYRLRLGVDPDARNLGARSNPILMTVG